MMFRRRALPSGRSSPSLTWILLSWRWFVFLHSRSFLFHCVDGLSESCDSFMSSQVDGSGSAAAFANLMNDPKVSKVKGGDRSGGHIFI